MIAHERTDGVTNCKMCSERDRCRYGVKCVDRWDYEFRVEELKKRLREESEEIKGRGQDGD